MATNEALKQQLKEYVKDHPNEHLRSMAEVFGVREVEIAANFENSVEIPVADFFDIWNEVASWETCLFYVDHGNVVVEAEGPLPKGTIMFNRTLLNLHDHGAPSEEHDHDHDHHHGTELGGHIYPSDLQAIYLIKKQLYGRESLAIMFYDSGERSMFGLFAGRGADRQILPAIRERFDYLWNKYSK
jgi:putative heme utilization carrier protein HutX